METCTELVASECLDYRNFKDLLAEKETKPKPWKQNEIKREIKDWLLIDQTFLLEFPNFLQKFGLNTFKNAIWFFSNKP